MPAAVLIIAVLSLFLNGQAAEFELAGIEEGVTVFVEDAAGTTNLLVWASNGAAVEYVLEKDGVALPRQSAPLGEVALNGLGVGRYFLSVFHGAASNDLSFTIKPEVVRPGNDDFRNARELVENTVVTASSYHATQEMGEPDHCGKRARSSLWWKWRAPANGTVTAATHGSDFDTRLAIYSGTALETLRLCADSDDFGGWSTSQVSFEVEAGEDYLVAVDGGPGTLQLLLRAGSPGALAWSGIADGTVSTNGAVTLELSDSGGVEFLLASGSFERSGTAARRVELEGLPNGSFWLTLRRMLPEGWAQASAAGFRVERLGVELKLAKASWMEGSWSVTAEGRPAREVTLQGSSNLILWTNIARWTDFTGAAYATQWLNGAQQFYRAMRSE